MTSYKEINMPNKYEDRLKYVILHENSDDLSLTIDAPDQVQLKKFSLCSELKDNLLTVVRVPKHMLLLCLTNFFCWSSLVCYSLYFTDFVAQEIYGK
jgi:solute carrier family 45 protein 1/2/4